jgi:valyl-tRNA synthetase
MMITATGQDVYLSNDKFEIGRNFGTKLWNVARYMQMQNQNTEDGGQRTEAKETAFDATLLSPDDEYILFKLDETIASCDEGLKKMRLNDAVHALYEFVWHQYCDWYVEYSKPILYGDSESERNHVLGIMSYVFSRSLRLLHPFMPFVTEELWHAMGYGGDSETISRAAWPEVRERTKDTKPATMAYVGDKYELIRAGRNLKADYGLPQQKEVGYIVKPASAESGEMLVSDRDSVVSLLKASELNIDSEFTPGTAMPSAVCKLGTVYMPLKGLVDVEVERARLLSQKEKIEKTLAGVTRKLENMDFVKKAPKDVVENQKTKKAELVEKVAKLARLIDALSE